jgi:hypothetical protein
MATRTKLSGLVVACLLATLTSMAWAQPAYDVYKYSQPTGAQVPIPDVDKPGVPPDPNPPRPGDLSCWQAVAANLLAGAGYGTGATPQARADAIYAQLNADLGFTSGGYTHRAINYWLYTYGKNPSSNQYDPSNSYTDVTYAYNSNGLSLGDQNMVRSDYNFLLDELVDCQYVGISIDNPDHALTLVGGNYYPAVGLDQSVVHDSDRTVGGTPDDVYTNVPAGFDGNRWRMQYNAAGPPSSVQSYTTLCPGLNKPQHAVENFDVAYFMDWWDPDGEEGALLTGFHPRADIRGVSAGAYTGPGGTFEPQWAEQPQDPNKPEFIVPNQSVPEWDKEVWLLIDFIDRDRAGDPGVDLLDDNGVLYEPTSYEWSEDGGQVLVYWDLPVQPDWEVLVFPSLDYQTLTGVVKDWDVATYCIPEPTSLVLLGIGSMLIARRRAA